MPLWVPGLIGGLSALLGADAADEAADAQTSASQSAAAEARRQYDINRADTAPYRNVGNQALATMGSIYGYDATRDPVGQATQQNALIQSGSGGFGGSPLNQQDWESLNRHWGAIRDAGNFGDINWNAGNFRGVNFAGNPLSAEANNFVGNNWSNIRRAANLGDINWNAGIVGTPGYQQQQITGQAPGAAPISSRDMGWDMSGGVPRPTSIPGSPQNAMPGVGAAPAAAGQPDYSAFFKSPDYEFVRGEGQRGIENSFAARGGAQSGNALRELAKFNSGLASGNFYNYMNQQNNLAGLGQTAVNTSANAGANYAGMAGNAMMNAGEARASGVLGRNAAIANGITQGYENFLYRQPWRGSQSGRGGSWG